MADTVIVIEMRELVESSFADEHYLDCTVMHLSSTWELAEAWIREHMDANSSDGQWHWWLGEDIVDEGEIAHDHHARIYEPQGREVTDEDEQYTLAWRPA